MFFPIWFRVDARSCWQLLWNRLLKPQTCRTKVSWCLLGNHRWLGKNMLSDYWRLVTVPSLFASMLLWPSSRLLHIVCTEDSNFFVCFPKFHLSKYVGCSTEEPPPLFFLKANVSGLRHTFFQVSLQLQQVFADKLITSMQTIVLCDQPTDSQGGFWCSALFATDFTCQQQLPATISWSEGSVDFP